MSDYYDDDENSEVSVPLSEMRGVCSFNYNGRTVFVLADVESVASALTEERGASRWEKNVMNREVELARQCFFIFRFRGHIWTNIIGRDTLVLELLMNQSSQKLERDELEERLKENLRIELNEEDARLLSFRLQTKTIFYEISDTACALGYSIYENGNLLERLNTDEGYEITEWNSTIHDITKDEIENVEAWVEQLFRDQDALEPSIHFTRWVGYVLHEAGHKVKPTDSNNVFERTDFVAL